MVVMNGLLNRPTMVIITVKVLLITGHGQGPTSTADMRRMCGVLQNVLDFKKMCRLKREPNLR